MTNDYDGVIAQSLLENIAVMLPEGIMLRGIAIQLFASDEGALIQWEGSMTADADRDADVWSGIAQDARQIYLEYIGDMMIEHTDPTIH